MTTKEWRLANQEHLKAYRKKWNAKNGKTTRERNKKSIVASAKKWKKTHPEHVRKRLQEWRKSNPEKVKAYNRIQIARRNGHVRQKPCEECGNPDSYAHHDDYTKPLDVRWLCRIHHHVADRRVKPS